MPDGNGLYPPAQYGWGWLLVVLAALIVGITVALLIAHFTRADRVAAAPPLPPQPSADPVFPDQIRADYLHRLQLIEAEFRAGRLDGREVNRRLSQLVRGFVHEYNGLEAPVMTLGDLVERGVHPALIDAIGRHYYPSLFRRNTVVDPIAGINAARTVVQVWN